MSNEVILARNSMKLLCGLLRLLVSKNVERVKIESYGAEHVTGRYKRIKFDIRVTYDNVLAAYDWFQELASKHQALLDAHWSPGTEEMHVELEIDETIELDEEKS